MKMKHICAIAFIVWATFITYHVVQNDSPIKKVHASTPDFYFNNSRSGSSCIVRVSGLTTPGNTGNRNVTTSTGYESGAFYGSSTITATGSNSGTHYTTYTYAGCDIGSYVAAVRIHDNQFAGDGWQMGVICCPLN